jgi:hypothetical protein
MWVGRRDEPWTTSQQPWGCTTQYDALRAVVQLSYTCRTRVVRQGGTNLGEGGAAHERRGLRALNPGVAHLDQLARLPARRVAQGASRAALRQAVLCAGCMV